MGHLQQIAPKWWKMKKYLNINSYLTVFHELFRMVEPLLMAKILQKQPRKSGTKLNLRNHKICWLLVWIVFVHNMWLLYSNVWMAIKRNPPEFRWWFTPTAERSIQWKLDGMEKMNVFPWKIMWKLGFVWELFISVDVAVQTPKISSKSRRKLILSSFESFQDWKLSSIISNSKFY